MIVAIVANGDAPSTAFLTAELTLADIIIAVDGGMNHLRSTGVTPNVLVGDLDSFHAPVDQLPSDIEVIKLPTQKNVSDLEYAIEVAVKRGATELRFFAMTGDRLDHTLINLNVIMRAADKATVSVRDERQILRVAQSHNVLDDVGGKTFSIVPLSEVTGISIVGAEYPLDNFKLSRYSSRCLSNVALENRVIIKIERGEAFIVVNRGTV